MPYCQEKADKALNFISLLTHAKGQWAGQRFQILDWQKELIEGAFGNVKEDGTRQYRTVYCEIPKKNGKSELAAAVALYMLTADGEAGPEVYSAAADRDQAGLVYGVASEMVRNNAVLSKYLKILDSRKRIINRRNNGFYQVLSSDVKTKHGLNPSCVVVDELHAQPNDELWRVLTSGTDYARKQQLVFVLTTAGVFNKESIWWRVREKARQIRDGIVKDDSFLPVLYIADPETDDPADEELWKRVNPSLGRIFTLEKIRQDYETARQDPVEFEDFKRFRLNIPIKSLSRWMPMDKWDNCASKIDVEALKGRPCYGGLDLSSKLDLSAFLRVFPPVSEGDRTVVLPSFYCPEDTIIERSRSDKVRYDIWAKDGLITATPGNVIDYAAIRNDILQTAKDYDLREVGFDPWGASQLATELQNDHGITMVEMRQGAKTMSEPAKDILVKVMQGQLVHGGHRVLRWCTDNLVMVPDANENIRPAKDKATDRIDGFVALILAWGRAMFFEPYDQVGIKVIE